MIRLTTSIVFALFLSACSDSGVVIGDGTGNGNGNNAASTGSGGNNPSPDIRPIGGTTGNTTGGTSGGTTSGTTGSATTSGTGGGTTGSGTTSGGAPVVENPGTGDPVTTEAASNLDPADVDAARFLNQATFGANAETIAEFRRFPSKAAWIDAQMQLPVSLTQPYTRANSNGSLRKTRHVPWWNNAVSEPDQLRQRMAFALSQIFVVSDIDKALSNNQYAMTDYYDMLANNAFGNYRQILEKVTLHPVMGRYLSMVRNEKANPAENIRPDENFAREVLQLFSIGLHELDNQGEPTNPNNPIPSYDQKTIEEFARVFTGWEFPRTRRWGDTGISSDNYIGRMVPFEEFHDFGSKTLLNGAVVPAGLSTSDDMQAALDNIFQHQNVGPFIGKQLIQRFVTSNPSPEYVGRVAAVFNNNGNGERGDLAAVIKAILLDDEAQRGIDANPEFGKIREPNIKWAHYWRALDWSYGPDANGVHRTADFDMSRLDEMGGQAVLKSKSVFNFFLPDNPLVPGTKLLAPEMQIMSEAFIAATHINYHHQVYRFHNRANLNDDSSFVTITNLEPLADLSTNPDDLLDWYNLMYFGGSMPDTMRATLREYMLGLPNTSDGRFARAQDTLFMVMVSPASSVQR